MAGDPNSGQRSGGVQQALSVVDLGIQASTAYKRPDLVDRLRTSRRRRSGGLQYVQMAKAPVAFP